MKKKKEKKSDQVIAAYRENADSKTDVLGSYTGVPEDDNNSKPVQDADDL